MATTATNDPKALVAGHSDASTDSWFPLFEFQDWTYESVLILPTSAESNADPGTVVTAKKWAKGELFCGQAFNTADGYTLDGRLSFLPGVELLVSGKGALGVGNNPAPFEATGTGTDGPTKGAIYQLVGWVFPEKPILNGAGRGSECQRLGMGSSRPRYKTGNRTRRDARRNSSRSICHRKTNASGIGSRRDPRRAATFL
jgi:hypothetical protein